MRTRECRYMGVVAATLLAFGAVHASDVAIEAGAARLAQDSGPDSRLRLHPTTGAVRFLQLPAGRLSLDGTDPAGRAADFLHRYRDAFGIRNASRDLSPPLVTTDRYGHTRVAYRQILEGVPVFAGELRVHFGADGELIAVNGTVVPGLSDLDTTPRLRRAQAEAVALDVVTHALKEPPASDLVIRNVRLVVYQPGLAVRRPGRPHLTWEVEVVDAGAVRQFVWIDAHDGATVDRVDAIHEALSRRVDQPTLGQFIWAEGDPLPYASGNPTNDAQVNGIIESTASIYDLFQTLSGGSHPSWDGADGEMIATWKPFFLQCPNATWNGTSANFCDGVASDDVVVHEWVHAYTQSTHELIYQAQPGALNEAYSDIFGELVDLLNGSGTDAPASPRSDDGCSLYGGSPTPEFTIGAPASLAGSYLAAGAAFNPAVGVEVTAAAELVNDNQNNGGATLFTDGCEPFVGFTPGRIALIDRGGCPFSTKAVNAQGAGAAGAIVINGSGGPFNMGGSAPGLTIPSVMIGMGDGMLLRAEPAGSVSVTLRTSVATADSLRWLIAEDSFSLGGAIRDMWNPTCFGHPGKVSDLQYWCGKGDAGGVHVNSGIPNHAFALLVDGGSYGGTIVEPIGLLTAAHLYWRAMDVYQVADTGFADHAAALTQSCTDLIGVELGDLQTGAPSGRVVGVDDCNQVAAAIDAVELELAPACSFEPLLDPAVPAPTCGTAVFHEDFETDPVGRWAFSNTGVYPEYVPRDWQWTAEPPGGGGGGSALFADDDASIGNCILGVDDQTRVLSAESPSFTIDGADGNGSGAVLTFEHYVATEYGRDGGNLSISVNGGPYAPVQSADFDFNPYNTTLDPPGATNANPLAGQPAFSGSDDGAVTGSWGLSEVALGAYVDVGDTVRLRLDFGTDGCSGLDGWYVDDLRVCTSTVTAGTVPDGYRSPGEQLTMEKSGRNVHLAWGASCHGADSDYEVYEGTLGIFPSHLSRLCSTSGQRGAQFQGASGNRYYLVVSSNGSTEGSYGTDSSGLQRPRGLTTCRSQSIYAGCGRVDVTPGNDAPIISSTPATLADHNREWRYEIVADDPDGDTVTITFDQKPDWVEYDGGTRTMSTTAGWDRVGTYPITLRATDGQLSNIQSFVLTVQKGEIICDQPFGEPDESLYVLPWPVGGTYRVQNAHCPPNPNWGHQNTFAYDFDLAIGDPVIASRAGRVLFVRESNMDGNRTCGTGGENWVFVQHADGTVMQYVHLTFNGALVNVGEFVQQGQTIGLSGDTGCSAGPHLHTWLFRDATDFSRKASLPVNYRNASGPLDSNDALAIGGTYTALPFVPDDR